MTLDVAIPTHKADGILRLASMDLPRVEGVRYVVSWQAPGGAVIPSQLADREDVVIQITHGTGLSVNRNNALDHSTADIVLNGDDDLIYYPEGLRAVIKTFEENPGLEMASFMYDGADSKIYPTAECSLRKFPKGFYTTSFELAFRRDSRAGGLRYDTRFGLNGTVFTIGEDDLLLMTARRRGYDVRFFPVMLCRHTGPTTGVRQITDPRSHRGTGAILALEYPVTHPLRIVLKAWRGWRRGQMSLLPAIWHMAEGAVWAIFKFRRPW